MRASTPPSTLAPPRQATSRPRTLSSGRRWWPTAWCAPWPAWWSALARRSTGAVSAAGRLGAAAHARQGGTRGQGGREARAGSQAFRCVTARPLTPPAATWLCPAFFPSHRLTAPARPWPWSTLVKGSRHRPDPSAPGAAHAPPPHPATPPHTPRTPVPRPGPAADDDDPALSAGTTAAWALSNVLKGAGREVGEVVAVDGGAEAVVRLVAAAPDHLATEAAWVLAYMTGGCAPRLACRQGLPPAFLLGLSAWWRG